MLQDRNVVSLPLQRKGHRSHMTTLTILKRFDFTAHLLRSGVLALDSCGHSHEAVYFARGAPSAIEQLVGLNTLPPDYQQVQ